MPALARQEARAARLVVLPVLVVQEAGQVPEACVVPLYRLGMAWVATVLMAVRDLPACRVEAAQQALAVLMRLMAMFSPEQARSWQAATAVAAVAVAQLVVAAAAAAVAAVAAAEEEPIFQNTTREAVAAAVGMAEPADRADLVARVATVEAPLRFVLSVIWCSPDVSISLPARGFSARREV